MWIEHEFCMHNWMLLKLIVSGVDKTGRYTCVTIVWTYLGIFVYLYQHDQESVCNVILYSLPAKQKNNIVDDHMNTIIII